MSWSIEAVSSDPQTAADCRQRLRSGVRRVPPRHRQNPGQRRVWRAVQAALKSYATSTPRQSAEYLQLKQSQQALQLQLQSLTGDYSVTSPATPPSVPFSPRKHHTLALHLILGLLLGMGLAFLLEQLDTRVRDERELTRPARPAGPRPPAAAGAAHRRERRRCRCWSTPSGPMAEAIRVLRGNLGFTSVDGDVRSLLVSSSIRERGQERDRLQPGRVDGARRPTSRRWSTPTSGDRACIPTCTCPTPSGCRQCSHGEPTCGMRWSPSRWTRRRSGCRCLRYTARPMEGAGRIVVLGRHGRGSERSPSTRRSAGTAVGP